MREVRAVVVPEPVPSGDPASPAVATSPTASWTARTVGRRRMVGRSGLLPEATPALDQERRGASDSEPSSQ